MPEEPDEPTLSEVMETKLTNGHWERSLSRKTYALNEMVWRTRIKNDPVGSLPISMIGSADVQNWLVRVERTVSKATALRYYTVLRGELPKSVTAKVKPPHVLEPAKEVLSPKEVAELLDIPTKPRLRIALLLCLHGICMGEALALTVEDVVDGFACVRKQVIEVNGAMFLEEVLKEKRRYRDVPIDAAAQKEIDRFLNGRRSGFILQAKNGKPWRPSNLRRDWGEAYRDTKFAKFGRHDARSTFGMLMLERGDKSDIRTAAEIMGHSPEMLVKMYARSRPELKKKAVKSALRGLIPKANQGTNQGTKAENGADTGSKKPLRVPS